MRTLALVLALILAAPALAAAQECPAPPEDETIDFGAAVAVTVETEAGAIVFQTEIAETPEEKARGMMFRPEMGDDEAMLFLFEEAAAYPFWMRNTCVALDLLYLRADGVIVGVVHEAQPFSEILLPSPGPVRAVLEIPGGQAETRAIRPGDRVVHEAIGG